MYNFQKIGAYRDKATKVCNGDCSPAQGVAFIALKVSDSAVHVVRDSSLYVLTAVASLTRLTDSAPAAAWSYAGP